MHPDPAANVLKGMIVGGMAAVVLAGSLATIAVLFAGDVTDRSDRTASHAAQKIAAVQLAAGCGRTQVQRAYLQLRAREFRQGDIATSVTTKLAPFVFPILWCERTFAIGYRGPAVLLTPAWERCFLRLVKSGYFNQRRDPASHQALHAPFTDPPRLKVACARRHLT